MTFHHKFHLVPLLIAMGLFFIIPSLAEIASGTWGPENDSAEWTLDDSGVLTITNGTGKAFSDASSAPWYAKKNDIVSVTLQNVTLPTDCQHLFNGLSNAVSIHFAEDCRITRVTSTIRMFAGCSSLSEITGLSLFDGAATISMDYMFCGCSSLPSIDISPFFLAERKSLDLTSMFEGCSSLREITFFHNASDAFPVYSENGSAYSNITLNKTFYGCSSLKTIDLRFSFPDGSTATPIKGMTQLFYGCTALETADLSSFRPDPDKVNATSLSGLFTGCNALSRVTLGEKLPAVTLPSVEINGHADWFSLLAKDWFTSKQIYTNRKYVYDTYTKSIPEDAFPPGTILSGSWGSCPWTIDVDSGALTVGGGTDILEADSLNGTSPWLAYVSLIRSASFVRVGLKADNNGLLKDLVNLASVSFAGCEMSGTDRTSYQSLFEGCAALTNVDLSGLPLSNVTSVRRMFADCASLVSLDFSDFGSRSNQTPDARAEALIGCISLQSLSYGAFFSLQNTGLPMIDAEGYYDWHDGAKWYASAEAFPGYSQEAGLRHVFTKTGPMTDLSDAEILLVPDSTVTDASPV